MLARPVRDRDRAPCDRRPALYPSRRFLQRPYLRRSGPAHRFCAGLRHAGRGLSPVWRRSNRPRGRFSLSTARLAKAPALASGPGVDGPPQAPSKAEKEIVPGRPDRECVQAGRLAPFNVLYLNVSCSTRKPRSDWPNELGLTLVSQTLLVAIRPHSFATLMLGNFRLTSFLQRAHKEI